MTASQRVHYFLRAKFAEWRRTAAEAIRISWLSLDQLWRTHPTHPWISSLWMFLYGKKSDRQFLLQTWTVLKDVIVVAGGNGKVNEIKMKNIRIKFELISMWISRTFLNERNRISGRSNRWTILVEFIRWMGFPYNIDSWTTTVSSGYGNKWNYFEVEYQHSKFCSSALLY